MRIMQTQATQKTEWELLKGLLVEFGKRSGLFQDIDVRILGGSMGNPFQLRVKVRGAQFQYRRCRLRCQSNSADSGTYTRSTYFSPACYGPHLSSYYNSLKFTCIRGRKQNSLLY